MLLYEMITGFPPFFSTDKSKLFTMIFEKNVEIKSYFSAEVASLLTGLLTKQVDFFSLKFIEIVEKNIIFFKKKKKFLAHEKTGVAARCERNQGA